MDRNFLKIFCARFWRCFYCCRCRSNLPVFFARQKQTKLKAKCIFCCSASNYCELKRNNCELSVLSCENWNWRIDRLCKDPWITLRANRTSKEARESRREKWRRQLHLVSVTSRIQHYYHLSLNLFALLLLLLLLLWSYCCCCGGTTAAAAAASVVGLLWAAADNDVW